MDAGFPGSVSMMLSNKYCMQRASELHDMMCALYDERPACRTVPIGCSSDAAVAAAADRTRSWVSAQGL